MFRGIEAYIKHKYKMKVFWWKSYDTFDYKRAVESYCHRVGLQTEEEEKIKGKK